MLQDDRVDLSQCESSEKYFDLVSHTIPIADLYKIEGCCNNSAENPFCAVQIRIESMELQKKYKGRYLL